MASYKVGANGKAPSGLKAGDTVVTGGGTYKISGVNKDGSYTSSKVSNTSTHNYNGSYASNPSGGSSGSSSSSKPSGSSGGGSSGYSGGSSASGSSQSSGGWTDPHPNMDYSIAIRDFIANGYTDENELKYLMDTRDNKASSTPGLEQYKDDQLQAAARQYYNELLARKKQAEEAYNFDEVYSRADAARDAAIQSGVYSLQQQIPTINQSYDELARQAYIQKMMAQKALPSQLDAAGISGQGAAESTLNQQNNAYLQTLSGSELARQNSLQANRDAQENVKNTANLQYAQSATDIAMQQAQAARELYQMQLQERQNAIGNAMSAGSLTGYYGGYATMANKQWQSDSAYRDTQLDQNQQTIEYDRLSGNRQYAMQLWASMGYANQEVASILGVPVGSYYKYA